MSDETKKKLATLFKDKPTSETEVTSKYVGGKLDIDQYNELCRRLGIEPAGGGAAAFKALLEQWWTSTNQQD